MHPLVDSIVVHFDRASRALLRPVDIAWLAAFRLIFGLTMCVSVVRFQQLGWVDRLLVGPRFHFKYWGFGWIEPLPGPLMHALFVLLALFAAAMAFGFAFRVTATAFALGFSYIQLIDVSTYLNHYYLAALLAWLLCVSPAHRAWSVDAWIRRRSERYRDTKADPRNREHVATGWHYLFRFQIGVVYTFAGLAKGQGDWLLHGQPLRIWLGARTELPVLGPLFTLEGVPLLMSWAGFLFDTTIVGWLLWRKSRPWAYAVVIVFHTLTRLLFPIGMFPFIMVLSALVFFEPDWPRRLFRGLRRVDGGREPSPARKPEPLFPAPRFAHKLGVALGAAYCLVQLTLPVRYLAYGGNVLWHEQGMRLSWRVMVRAKGGQTTFLVSNRDTGRRWHVSAATYLTGLQEDEMSSQPDLILQLAHHIAEDFERRGLGPVEVRADSRASLNGRRSARLIDPRIDLAEVRDGLALARWVLPTPTEPPPHTTPVL